ncbi:type II secretion system protein GspL [Sphingobium cloacae]|nr:type II secretion system protein GspL [Sphingobium cloacae]
MSGKDALIVALPDGAGAEPLWMHVADGAVAQRGAGANWLAACGLAELPSGMAVMLVPPAPLVTLHWASHPDLAPRQGQAAARLEALAGGIAPADQLFAVADGNNDPARPHLVALAARSDVQHWLLWAQHHGLDPDLIVPAPLLLPEPEEGFARGIVGGAAVWRGRDVAFGEDMALPEIVGEARVRDVGPAQVETLAIAALERPPLNLRQGDFAKRARREWDRQALGRIALWSGLVLLASLLIAVIGVVKEYGAASRLDAESLALAREVVPGAADAAAAESEMDRQLAARGAGGYAFTAPVSALMSAMQDAPGVSITALSRDADGMIRATLAAAKADDINSVLLALQAAGFTITATPSQDPGGRTLADITVRS